MEVLPDYQGIFRQKWGWKSMSYAVVRMQKMKSHDLKGIQFHNQRERVSKTNEDIHPERTHENYDLVNATKVDYNERVKDIIAAQKTGTRKTRKDAVLVNELLVTSDRHFFDALTPAKQREFFKASYDLLAARYGKQNMAYAMVHHDEKTPHLHVGVVPMRDGKLQGKNVFNRQELLWLQDEFPKQMSRLGFEWVRGEKGSDRAHMETAKFKKAESVRDCGVILQFKARDTGHLKLYKAWFCKSKLCSLCNWRRAMKHSAQSKAIITEVMKRKPSCRWLFFTFTVKNVYDGEELNKSLSDMARGFRKMVQYKKIDNNLIGFMRTTEVTVNKKDNSYNQHIHAMMCFESSYFRNKKIILLIKSGKNFGKKL